MLFYREIEPKEFDIKKALGLAEKYGLSGNIWHDAVAFRLATDENPLSRACEGHGEPDGTLAKLGRSEFADIRKIFTKENEASRLLKNYTPSRLDFNPNFAVGEIINEFASNLEEAKDDEEFFRVAMDFYKDYGVGSFGMYKAFRIRDKGERDFDIVPISGMEVVHLSDLVGYEIQKKKLVDNTEAFVSGRKANNVLLYGDSGTGKSSSIKAIVNEYYDRGLRLVEIYKHQLSKLSDVIAALRNRNYKFIIYMDDLSFEEFETDYKYLKAVIEGDVETRPDNVLIYATSNRRHIIKETWNDRSDVEMNNGIHKSDTMQEKLSLFHRFGVSIGYSKPSRNEYFDIVRALAKREGVNVPEKELLEGSVQWELSHGGISGRTAVQYIYYLLGQM